MRKKGKRGKTRLSFRRHAKTYKFYGTLYTPNLEAISQPALGSTETVSAKTLLSPEPEECIEVDVTEAVGPESSFEVVVADSKEALMEVYKNTLSISYGDIQRIIKKKQCFFKEQNAAFSAQIHIVSLTKTLVFYKSVDIRGGWGGRTHERS